MAVPVSLKIEEFTPIEEAAVDLRVCKCGHLIRRHDPEYGSCRLTSRGGHPRCLCAGPSAVGETTTPGKWNRAQVELLGERSKNAPGPKVHPFEAALRAGATFEWADGQPTCDTCGKRVVGEVHFFCGMDGQTRIECGCP